MKRKVSILVATLCCITMLFSLVGCNSAESFFITKVSPNPIFSTATKVEGVQEGDHTVAINSGEYSYFITSDDVMFSEAKHLTVFDAKTFTKLVDCPEVEGTTYGVDRYMFFDRGYNCFTLTTTANEKSTVKMYGVDMKEIASAEFDADDEEYPEHEEDTPFVVFDGKAYRILADGKLGQGFEVGFAKLPKATSWTDKNTYYFDEDAGILTIYDDKTTVVSSTMLPTSGETCFGGGVLPNGNVLIQWAEYVDEFSNEYNLIADGDKFNFHSAIIDVKTGKMKKVKLDYVILDAFENHDMVFESKDTYAYSENFGDYCLPQYMTFFSKKGNKYAYAEVASVGADKNQSFIFRPVLIDNNGKIVTYLDEFYAGQKGYLPARIKLAKNPEYYLINDFMGTTTIYNMKKGKVVATLSSENSSNGNMIFASPAYGELAIYNYELKKVYEIGDKGFDYLAENCIVYKEVEEVEYAYLVKIDGTETQICKSEDLYFVNDQLYSVKNGEVFDVYNCNGVKVLEGLAEEPESEMNNGKFAIIKSGNDYYKVA